MAKRFKYDNDGVGHYIPSKTPRRDINAVKAELAILEAEQEAAQLVKAPPNGKEKYLGNGRHDWETVVENILGDTKRLRVPGGWLYTSYWTNDDGIYEPTGLVFVPLPAAIGYAV